MDDPLDVPGGPRIPLAELSWRFTPGGGPGGQHANRASTAAAGPPSTSPVPRR
ncbi:MAG: hypothetical protein U5R31_12430 [Acidimicrobiia bacterium]|nr:hypothetical protein [Acidimicrobiia bacterium]